MADLIYPKVIVLATNSEGAPEFYMVSVGVTQQEMLEGKHYELAKENAGFNCYEEPMIAFDATDPAAQQLGEALTWL